MWAFYTDLDLPQLLASLDRNDILERDLGDRLSWRFNADGEEFRLTPKQKREGWRVTGNEFIGRIVTRQFGDDEVLKGIVRAYLPPDSVDKGDPPFWFVTHQDGDQEELEE